MRTPPRLRGFAVLAAFAYGTALTLIAFWPTPVDQPFQGPIRHAIEWLQVHGAGFVTYTFVESMANVALFMPFGFLVVLILGAKRWWLTVALGASLSVMIELGQHYFLSARFSTIEDVFANTAGTIVGTVIGLVLLLALRTVAVRRHRKAVASVSMRVPREPQRTGLAG